MSPCAQLNLCIRCVPRFGPLHVLHAAVVRRVCPARCSTRCAALRPASLAVPLCSRPRWAARVLATQIPHDEHVRKPSPGLATQASSTAAARDHAPPRMHSEHPIVLEPSVSTDVRFHRVLPHHRRQFHLQSADAPPSMCTCHSDCAVVFLVRYDS